MAESRIRALGRQPLFQHFLFFWQLRKPAFCNELAAQKLQSQVSWPVAAQRSMEAGKVAVGRIRGAKEGGWLWLRFGGGSAP